MSVTWTMTRGISRGGQSISKTESVVSEGEQQVNLSIPDATTDKQVDVEIVNSRLKGLFILSDQALTLETNNGTTPDNTVTLTANVPVIWTVGCGLANPFAAADVENLYVTNSSGAAANFELYALFDATP